MAPGYSTIVYEPYGVALIIAPFNYPIGLTLAPLVGAICAGNCAVIKPSELATEVEKLLLQYLPMYVDPGNDIFPIIFISLIYID
jgi:aldehyde dehydrogenase (NAD+)